MLKLELDQPVEVKLLKQQPRVGTGQFASHVYDLEMNGMPVEFSATDNVHTAIQEKVREGMTFELVKRQHSTVPGRTVIWVNVEEPGEAYFEPDKTVEPPTPFGNTDPRDPMLEEILKKVTYIADWVTRQSGAVKPPDDDKIPF